jgi:hypothetical protein
MKKKEMPCGHSSPSLFLIFHHKTMLMDAKENKKLNSLIDAAKTGKIPTVEKNGFILVDRKDAEAFMKGKGLRPAAGKKKQEKK